MMTTTTTTTTRLTTTSSGPELDCCACQRCSTGIEVSTTGLGRQQTAVTTTPLSSHDNSKTTTTTASGPELDCAAASQRRGSSTSAAAAAAADGGGRQRCAACGREIVDRFLLYAIDRYWHTGCLRCSACHAPLADLAATCFTRAGMTLCRDDYVR